MTAKELIQYAIDRGWATAPTHQPRIIVKNKGVRVFSERHIARLKAARRRCVERNAKKG